MTEDEFPELDPPVAIGGHVQWPGEKTEAVPPYMVTLPGRFWIREKNPPGKKGPREFIASLSSAAVVTAGYGGWSRVARPRRKALTEWVGRDSVSISINFILNDLAKNRGAWIEDKCQILDELAGVEAGDPEPPLLELHSDPPGIVPHSYERASHVRWFIETLTWDQEAIRYNGNGNRTHAAGTLVLTQFVKDERLRMSKRKKKDDSKGRRKTYRVKRGDTLQKIAARKDVYGDRHKWRRIAKANKIRDPKLGPKWVGKVLKIP